MKVGSMKQVTARGRVGSGLWKSGPSALSPRVCCLSSLGHRQTGTLWTGTGHFASDHDTPLPAYLSRHTTLGFDSDDVAALISAIDSSQGPRSSKLPHLPAEILFQIVEFAPVDHILTWRLVCRGFRDAIDGPVQYEHLRRAQLVGYLGPHAQYPLNQLRYVHAHGHRGYKYHGCQALTVLLLSQ
jgi:hypothetical protein